MNDQELTRLLRSVHELDVREEQARWNEERANCLKLSRAHELALTPDSWANDEREHVAGCRRCRHLLATMERELLPQRLVAIARPNSHNLVRWLQIAAAVLLIVALTTVSGLAIHYRNELLETRENLIATNKARPVTPSAEEAFRQDFDAATRVTVHASPGRPGVVVLEPSPFLEPPYVMAADVVWYDGADPERFYYAGRQPLEPFLEKDYNKLGLMPKSGERQVVVRVTFHTTGEAINIFQVAKVVREIPLILSPAGVRVGTDRDGASLTAAIVEPASETLVDQRFLLRLTLRRPAVVKSDGFDRIAHVLVRPLDGYPGAQANYYVVPFRRRVDSLPNADTVYPVWISLSSIGDAIPDGEAMPTRFEVLVVDLPFVLTGWLVDKTSLDFSRPDLSSAVRVRSVFSLKSAVDATTPVPGASSGPAQDGA